MLSSVVQSQDAEVTIAKQPIMAEIGREVRAIVNAMPAEVSSGLMTAYVEPAAHVMTAMEVAISAREMVVDNASQEKGIDSQWLSNAGPGREISESVAAAGDEWNAGKSAS